MGIYLLRNLLNLVAEGIRDLSRADFLAVTVVLRLIVEEFIFCNNLDYRKGDILLTIIIYGASQLTTYDSSLCYEHITFREGIFHGLVEILRCLHLGNAETASSVGRFDEHRKAELLHCLLRHSFKGFALAHKDIISTFDKVHILEVALAGELVESYG